MNVVILWPKSPLGNFNYIIHDNRDAYVIDPYDATLIVEQTQKLGVALKGVINTHDHWDHTKANIELQNAYSCDVICHTNSTQDIPGATVGVKSGDKLELSGDISLDVIETPGHTENHICLILNKGNIKYAVFSGDTLFNAGVGNCKNGGDSSRLYETISSQFFSLGDNVLVYPGHDYILNNLKFTLSVEPTNEFAAQLLEDLNKYEGQLFCPKITTIAEEKKINSFFRLNSDAIRQRLNLCDDSDKEVFIKLRSMRDKW